MSTQQAACGCVLPGLPSPGARRRACLTVDIHCHVACPEMEPLVADHPARAGEPALQLAAQGAPSIAYNRDVMFPSVASRLADIAERLADMDTMGVDVQVISPAPGQYHYWADPDLAARIVEMQNQDIAALVAAHPGRLAGLGAIAWQHPELAVEQLRRAVEVLGLKGVEVSTAVAGRGIAEPVFEPIWAEAERLGALVFIHPLGCSLGARLNLAYLSNSVGQPVETAVALSQIIFSGLLDRYPRLKICAAHGGGYLPTYAGRMEHAWQTRSDARTMARPPSSYLRQLWFDSLVYAPAAVRHLIDVVGVSQVVVGTDYPYDMGDYGVHALIDGIPGLSEAEREAILGGNLVALLGLDPAASRHAG
jgi:aminocarboxymuconate-semialdehyde decarboxylase